MAHGGEAPAVSEVRAVLQRFQDGYTGREIAAVDAFWQELFVPDEDQLIVGTGHDEWCHGPESVRELLRSDWEFWGDVAIDVPGAHIWVSGDVAWLVAPGIVSNTVTAEDFDNGTLKSIERTLSGAMNHRAKLLEIGRITANTLFETGKGDRYVWPFRFAAVLVRRQGRWLFHQLQFSFPTTRTPDERIVES